MQSLHAFLLRRDFIMLSTRWLPLYATNLGQDCAMLNTSAPAYTCAEQDGFRTSPSVYSLRCVLRFDTIYCVSRGEFHGVIATFASSTSYVTEKKSRPDIGRRKKSHACFLAQCCACFIWLQ
jgi:hypothetical protein